MTTRTRRRLLADGGLVLVLGLTLVSVVAGATSPLSWDELLEGFVVTSTAIGLSLGLAGYPIARLRPDNAVGWLLLSGGVAYGISGAGYAVLAWGTSAGEDSTLWRVLADVTSIGWPLAVALFIPMSLLFFPDGQLPGPRWRVVVAAAVAGTIGFTAAVTLGPEDTTTALGVSGFLRWPVVDSATWIGTLSSALITLVYICLPLSLFVRYRRGSAKTRAQLLWVLLAALIMVAAFIIEGVLQTETWLGIVVILLPPWAILIAILRYQLLDIRLVVSRSLLYLVLTSLVVLAYVVIVAVVDRVVSPQVPIGASVIATITIAVAFAPVRRWLQSRIDRIFYGERADPVQAVAQVGQQLGEGELSGDAGLSTLLSAICEVLTLPWAEIRIDGRTVASQGTPGPTGVADHRRTLMLGGTAVGELRIGLRRGQRRLDHKDERVLALLEVPAAVAVQATTYATDLQQTREQLVTAREEERRRVRDDLHDGLGPRLTGITLTTDAARRLIRSDPDKAEALLDDVRRQSRDAVDEIRRLARELQPPSLDVLGLVAAMEEQSALLEPLQVDVDAPDSLPPLPAAVEVAAYRIANEALTNVARHSPATNATLRLAVTDRALTIEVHDNAPNGDHPWVPGIGLTSMKERTRELGGTFSAGPSRHGGVVNATIPCGGAP